MSSSNSCCPNESSESLSCPFSSFDRSICKSLTAELLSLNEFIPRPPSSLGLRAYSLSYLSNKSILSLTFSLISNLSSSVFTRYILYLECCSSSVSTLIVFFFFSTPVFYFVSSCLDRIYYNRWASSTFFLSSLPIFAFLI